MKLDLDVLKQADDMEFADAVLHCALTYAAAGIPVLPLTKGGKMLPSRDTGVSYSSATTNKNTLRGWFDKGGKFRGHNLGIGCGTLGGVMALDIDVKNVMGTNGVKELAKLLKTNGALPAGPRQRTPSGGFHYIFLWAENAASSTNKVANGIDTRGGTVDRVTGHICAYPSQFDGKPYIWEEGGDVPAMPDWLRGKLGDYKTKQKMAVATSNVSPITKTEEIIEIPVHQVKRMLDCIGIDDVSYEDWVKVGMSLKGMYGDDGFDIWDEWSETGMRRTKGECEFRWKTFQDDGPVGFGTLQYLAKGAGWVPLPGDYRGSLDNGIEEAVMEFNKRYALVRLGKSVVVATFDDKRGVELLGMEGFYTLSANRKIAVMGAKGPTEKKMSEIWLGHEMRREYFQMGIYPHNDNDADTLNRWCGWGVTPQEGSCDKYLNHIREVICSEDQKMANWVLDWMADAVQNPRDIKGTCIVLRGVEGCGKGVFADTFGKLFGKHYFHLIDSGKLTGRFNSFIADSIVVYADEVLWPGDRQAANVLKGLVTERNIMMEQKNVDAVMVENLIHLIIASNEDWIVPAGPNSRRWLILNVSPKYAKNAAYFKPLMEEINDGGKEALLQFLMDRKITNDLRTAPETHALIEQRQFSHAHDSLLNFFAEILERGGFESLDVDAKMGDENRWPSKLMMSGLFDEYRTWCKETNVSKYDMLSMPIFKSKILNFGFKVNNSVLVVPTAKELKDCVSSHMGITDLKEA